MTSVTRLQLVGLGAIITALGVALGCGEDVHNNDQSQPAGSPQFARTEIAPVLTELAAGGPFAITDQAEQMVGYQLLRPDPTILTEYDESGIVDVYSEIGLPRVRQGFRLLRNDEMSLDLTQEPETYPESPPHGQMSNVTFGAFSGVLTEYEGQIDFTFLTGVSLKGVAIRASVTSLGDHSREDIRLFVESLTFAQ